MATTPALTPTPPWQTPIADKKGNLTPPWVTYFQEISAALANTGGSGNNTVTSSYAPILADPSAQRVQNLEEKVKFILTQSASALSVGIQAVETQQAANSVTTAADVLDLINLSDIAIILNINMYLAALPDSNANLDIYVCWNDVLGGSSTPNANITSSNSNTECVLLGPPATLGSTQDLQLLTIYNADVISANLAIYNNSSGVPIDVLERVFLPPGYTLVFDADGFKVMNASGVPLR